jgi:hypothetical protein
MRGGEGAERRGWREVRTERKEKERGRDRDRKRRRGKMRRNERVRGGRI